MVYNFLKIKQLLEVLTINDLTLPWSVSESLSTLVVLEVDMAGAVVHTVLHRHRLVNKRPHLLQSWLHTLDHLVGVLNVKSVA